MNNNYEDLKQIIKAVKKPETGVELMSYKYLFELFEKAYLKEKCFRDLHNVLHPVSDKESLLDWVGEEVYDKILQAYKEHQEIKKQFYKTLGGIND